MSEIGSLGVMGGILVSMISLATPFLYAAIGETFAQTSGVLNLGVEGIMLLAAYGAFYVALNTGNLWLAMLVAVVIGLLMGLLMAFISVTLKAEQGISGIGLYMFGLGASSLLFKLTIGTVKTIEGFQAVKIPLLGDLPVVGPILFDHSIPVYGAFLLVPISWWVLSKTTLGLRIKAVGQNPAAADSLGISVDGVRYFSVCLGSVLAGITMSPGMDAIWPWLLDLFGGRQSARSIHFIVAFLLVLFVLVHLAMVLLAGPINEVRSMITGRYRLPKENGR